MKATLAAMGLALAIGVAGCTTTGGGYGQPGYGQGGGGTALSRCMRNALIGAGVGAVAGAVIGDEDNRVENAAIGAAVGGAGTFGACKLLDASEQRRIETAYVTALETNRPYTASWTTASGSAKAVQVGQPVPAGGGCYTINAQLTQSNRAAPQPLPTERYCPTPQGWVPA